MSSDINVQTFSGKVNITSNLLVGSSHLFVDTINNRVGLVTNTPSAGLHVNSNAYVHTDFRVGSGIVMNDTTGRITAGAFHGDGTNITGINSDSGSWVNGTDVVYLSTIGDKVGIGTTSPDKLLEISGASGLDNSSPVHFRITNTQSATSASPFTDITKPSGLISFYTPDTSTAGPGDVAGIGFRPESTLGGDTALCFYTNSENDDAGTPLQERMCITHDGNVGIGTTDPKKELHVYGDGTETDILIGEDTAIDKTSLIRYKQGDGSATGVLQFGHWGDSFGTNPKTLCIKSGGNVGIGTTSPNENLEIYGDGIRIHDPDSSPKLDFVRGGTSRNPNTETFGLSDYADWRITANGPRLNFQNQYTGGNSGNLLNVMTLEHGTGNVGIGTTTPDKKLHIYTAASESNTQLFLESADRYATMQMKDNSGGVLVQNDQGDLRLITGYDASMANGSEAMRIKGSGNVGIGTDSPTEALHIYRDGSDPTYAWLIGNTSKRAGIIFSEDTGKQAIIEYDGTGTGEGNYLAFYSGVSSWTSKGDGLNFIPSNGRVGIGTTDPRNVLELKTTGSTANDSALLLLYKTTGNGVGIDFCDQSIFLQKGYLRYHHQDGQSLGAGNCFKFSSTEASEALVCGGSLLIGVDGKDNGAAVNGRKNLFIQSTYGGNTSQNYGWWMGAQNQGLASSDNDLYFNVVRNGTLTSAGWIQDSLTNIQMNFTGQHRTFVKGTPTNQLEDKEGLIVIADQNEFVKMSGGVAYGNDAITVNESLPVVSFSNKSKDKRCFGVLSTTEDPETRKEVYGNFGSIMHKEVGDTRVYVNSVGEGAVWVINENGTLESGDYITTSNVSAYGMKQDDDLLHNYTVAKILMDCDFNPKTQPKRIIKKEPKMVDYWIRYGDVKITEEEYNTLLDSQRKIADDVHYRIDQMEVVKEDPEKEGFVYEQREDMVNVLDEHGEFQWEDTDETEKAYKIRYLDADGTQISEEEYTTKSLANEEVYIAAFVGCTYHCG